MSTLAARIKERMKAAGLTNAQLAKAAGVEPPTAHNWGSGKTKEIKAGPLLAAAAALGVNPHWLATGEGPKFPDSVAAPVAAEPAAVYGAFADAWMREAIEILQSLTPEDRRAAVIHLRVFIKSLGPPKNGNHLPVAA